MIIIFTSAVIISFVPAHPWSAFMVMYRQLQHQRKVGGAEKVSLVSMCVLVLKWCCADVCQRLPREKNEEMLIEILCTCLVIPKYPNTGPISAL